MDTDLILNVQYIYIRRCVHLFFGALVVHVPGPLQHQLQPNCADEGSENGQGYKPGHLQAAPAVESMYGAFENHDEMIKL